MSWQKYSKALSIGQVDWQKIAEKYFPNTLNFSELINILFAIVESLPLCISFCFQN